MTSDAFIKINLNKLKGDLTERNIMALFKYFTYIWNPPGPEEEAKKKRNRQV